MINFSKETIIPALIELAEKGASIAALLELIEDMAKGAGIDLQAAPAYSGSPDGEHEYRAYANWTQALYAGFKHHADVMQSKGWKSAPFVEYASSRDAVFGVSPFLIDCETDYTEDQGLAYSLEDLGNTEIYDLTTARDNLQPDWISWVRGPEEIVTGVETWLECFGGFDKETF